MGRSVRKGWILGSCCVAALIAVGCQSGTGARSNRMARNSAQPNAFSGKDALATQQRQGQMNPGMRSTRTYGSSSGSSLAGGQSMNGLNMPGPGGSMNSSMGGGSLGGLPPGSGVMPASYNSPINTTGTLPPVGTNRPMNSTAPSMTSPPFGSYPLPGTTSRDTVSPPPTGNGFGDIAPPPTPPSPTYNGFQSR